ncbi:MAG: 2-amino-4-hydroxy-6-hydroxymethyldihydropteridine diphosphokinase [Actinomycetota bacterium]|nr:2-amino-4-hydroxy-6-hydroxymethyldihydropteridine diphosphokinase [Actinomycetota bacterium]
MTASARAYLALGSNLGDRARQLQTAVDSLAAAPKVTVVAASSVYETDPVGGPEQGRFLNAVVALDTELAPRELLAVAQSLEADAGRVRVERWGPRTLDVDVLLVGDAVVAEPDLVVPHPRMWERGFVLAPLHDVAPDLVDVPEGGWSGVSRVGDPLLVPRSERSPE